MSPAPHVRGLAVTFDRAERIIFVDHRSRVRLETSAEVDAYFDAVVSCWRQETRGERVYFVVSYTNFSSHPSTSERYVGRVREILAECALAILRYGGDVPQRTTARRLAIILHVPSNLYETRDEAIEVVRGLRSGASAAPARASRPPKRSRPS